MSAALTPRQERILAAIREHGPISEAALAEKLYGDESRTATLQYPLVALSDRLLILPVLPPEGAIEYAPMGAAYRHATDLQGWLPSMESPQWRVPGQPA